MNLDLTALERFVAVVTHGGFSAAARALSIPRQSVHRSVSALEDGVGVPLLERGTHSASATAAGRRLHRRAVPLLRAAREAESALAGIDEVPSGRLRVQAPRAYTEATLTAALSAFLRRWPQVEVDLIFTEGPARDPAEVDLRVQVGGATPGTALALPLAPLERALCAAPHLADSLALPEPEALLEVPTIDLAGEPEPTWTLTDGSHTRHVSVGPRLRAPSLAVALDAAASGVGVALLPRPVVAAALESGTLVEVLTPWRPPRLDAWAIYSAHAEDDAALIRLVEALEAHAGA